MLKEIEDTCEKALNCPDFENGNVNFVNRFDLYRDRGNG